MSVRRQRKCCGGPPGTLGDHFDRLRRVEQVKGAVAVRPARSRSRRRRRRPDRGKRQAAPVRGYGYRRCVRRTRLRPSRVASRSASSSTAAAPSCSPPRPRAQLAGTQRLDPRDGEADRRRNRNRGRFGSRRLLIRSANRRSRPDRRRASACRVDRDAARGVRRCERRSRENGVRSCRVRQARRQPRRQARRAPQRAWLLPSGRRNGADDDRRRPDARVERVWACTPSSRRSAFAAWPRNARRLRPPDHLERRRSS